MQIVRELPTKWSPSRSQQPLPLHISLRSVPSFFYRTVLHCSSRRKNQCASCTRRKPMAPERSMLGAIIRSLPCSVNL